MTEIVSAVAKATGVDADYIRSARGGMRRMISAWIAYYDGVLTNGNIATGLRLKSDSRVTRLVRDCDRELALNAGLRDCIDRCMSTLRGKKSEVKL